jgi:crotonobetainyl-CoA:carnitine CoA-transferase CaiB-like acyl-CoA transferase
VQQQRCVAQRTKGPERSLSVPGQERKFFRLVAHGDRPSALDSITADLRGDVVTLEHAIAAPFCTRQLADLGARVIKVERPGSGDFARAYDERVRGMASHFVWTDVSMLESMVEWMSYPLYYAFDGAKPPPRAGAAHATIYPYDPFPAGDGKTVMLGLQNEREWVVFCDKVLQRPALASDERFASNSRRVAQREALRSIIVDVFSTLTAEQVIARLDEAQIANAHMNDMHNVWEHPQLKARKRWTEVQTPAGPIPALLPPGATEAFPPRMDAVPALGQHTSSILSELGWSLENIAAMRQTGAV